MSPHPHTARDKIHVSAEAVRNASLILSSLKDFNTRALTKNPRVRFFGRQALAFYASGSTENGGFGLFAQGILCHGTWHEDVRAALDVRAISISHLELAATSFLISLRKVTRQSACPLPVVI